MSGNTAGHAWGTWCADEYVEGCLNQRDWEGMCANQDRLGHLSALASYHPKYSAAHTNASSRMPTCCWSMATASIAWGVAGTVPEVRRARGRCGIIH